MVCCEPYPLTFLRLEVHQALKLKLALEQETIRRGVTAVIVISGVHGHVLGKLDQIWAW